MTRVVAASKRIWMALYTLVVISNFSPITTFVSKWATHWAANSNKIISLTVINTGITVLTEMTSRTVLASSVHKKEEYRFWKKNGSGFWGKINRHSLISIFMTLFASLIGAPVYFFKFRANRFLFFTFFGTFNSILGQSLSSFFLILPTMERLNL